MSEAAGRAAIEWVLEAGSLAKDGRISAIVTAPINKEAASLAGYKDVGHMEVFQSQTGAKEVATMLMADELRVVHLTTHRSLRVACPPKGAPTPPPRAAIQNNRISLRRYTAARG